MCVDEDGDGRCQESVTCVQAWGRGLRCVHPYPPLQRQDDHVVVHGVDVLLREVRPDQLGDVGLRVVSLRQSGHHDDAGERRHQSARPLQESTKTNSSFHKST